MDLDNLDNTILLQSYHDTSNYDLLNRKEANQLTFQIELLLNYNNQLQIHAQSLITFQGSYIPVIHKMNLLMHPVITLFLINQNPLT